MKKTIEQVDVAGKVVLLRADFNVPIENGSIRDDRRIVETLPTIRSVLDRGGRLVILSHMGRPKYGYEAGLSLAPVAKRLGELLGAEVAFPSAGDCSQPIDVSLGALENGRAMLLENLRFHAGEKQGDGAFAGKLAALGDIYCNDAFGASHRADASMVAVPEAMAGKPRVCGLLVRSELAQFHAILDNPAAPFVAVLGGAKVSDKIPAIEHLIPKASAILIGGAMAYTFGAALGKRVGKSIVEQGRLKDAKRILDAAAASKCDLHLPVDHVCSTEFAKSSGDIEVFEDNIGDGFMGLDIGPATQSQYAKVIAGAKTIAWNGPMGVFEWPAFSVGTQQVAEAIAGATAGGAGSLIGGGDTASAANRFGIAERVTHISTGGGASLALLAGERLKAIDLLDEA
ncbi:MAG: phosphoglycerate kinase [Phycisphaeraceae bacterium]|nr:phosphoglycerate kinase [Phycisphaeraceae bacterium]MCB9848345.1 phosphoglycerate kinase [Phycisphaeraceae bacterium]